eukprot:SAG31_NODE_9498_length_1268_cov_1.025663_2_plen_68_part_01
MSSDEDGDGEIDEAEMEDIREEYLMDLFTNCQTCLDPISGVSLACCTTAADSYNSLEERVARRAESRQ